MASGVELVSRLFRSAVAALLVATPLLVAQPATAATVTWTATCANNEITESPIPRSVFVAFTGGSGCSSSSVTVTSYANFSPTGSDYKLDSGAEWGWITVRDSAGNTTKFVVGASGEAPGTPQTPTVSLSGTTATITVTGATASGGLPDSFPVTGARGSGTGTISSPPGNLLHFEPDRDAAVRQLHHFRLDHRDELHVHGYRNQRLRHQQCVVRLIVCHAPARST